MSAELAARAAILATLRGDATLLALVNQIADGEPVKASAPWLLVGPMSASSWGARGVDGVALRLSLELAVRGGALSKVSDILDRVDQLLRSMNGNLGDWRVTALMPERSRIRPSETEWRAGIDYTMRLARLV